jgi:hypothetical protein
VRTVAYGDGVVGESRGMGASEDGVTVPHGPPLLKTISPTYNDSPMFIEALKEIALGAFK